MKTTTVCALGIATILLRGILPAQTQSLCNGGADSPVDPPLRQSLTAAVAGDIDGDGRDEFAVVTNADSATYWVRRLSLGNYQLVEVSSVGNVAQFPRAVHIADMNNDGRNDIISVGQDGPSPQQGQIGWFENTGTPEQSGWPFHRISTQDAAQSVPIDFNGDSCTDLAITREGHVVLLKNPGQGSNSWTEQVVEGDFIYPFEFDGSKNSKELLVKKGSDHFPLLFGPSGDFVLGERIPDLFNVSIATVADFNRDGRSDIIDSSLFAFTSSLVYPGEYESDRLSATPLSGSLFVTQVNGDQYPDIISFSSGLQSAPDGTYSICNHEARVFATTGPDTRPFAVLTRSPISSLQLFVMESDPDRPTLVSSSITGPFGGPLQAGERGRVQLEYRNTFTSESASIPVNLSPGNDSISIAQQPGVVPTLPPGESYTVEGWIETASTAGCGEEAKILVSSFAGESMVTDVAFAAIGYTGPQEQTVYTTQDIPLPDGTGESAAELVNVPTPVLGYIMARRAAVHVETADRRSIDVDVLLPDMSSISLFRGEEAGVGRDVDVDFRFEAAKVDVFGGQYFFIVTDRTANSPSKLTYRAISFERIVTDCTQPNAHDVARHIAGIAIEVPGPDTNADGIVDAADLIEFPE